MIVAIDRKTHDSDVLERVLAIDALDVGDDVRTEVVDLAVRPALAGVAVTAVTLTVGGLKPRRPKPKRRR
jgi:hypothetical protein